MRYHYGDDPASETPPVEAEAASAAASTAAAASQPAPVPAAPPHKSVKGAGFFRDYGIGLLALGFSAVMIARETSAPPRRPFGY